ncbi:MAG: ABC transporter ATP-binding protein, partial [Edwardsiella sp. (in: enterobacteria)]
AQLNTLEERLADSALYDPARKEELNDILQRQSQAKLGLEEAELCWLDAQEQLEAMSRAFTESDNA